LKILELKNYSLVTKVLVVFFFITVLLVFIRTFLAQPKIKEKNLKDDIELISKILLVTKDFNHTLTQKEEIKNSLLKNLELKSSQIEFFDSNLIDNEFSFKEVQIEQKIFLTWTLKLKIINSEKNIFLKYSIDKKELENKNRVDILVLFLLPETLVAIGISLFLLLIIFRRMLNNIELLNKKISKSLEEKEILLKEIHHRVKNNLALTISLLELQVEEIEDEKTKKVLINIQERIFTMELLHRKLYESTNLNQISFKNYVIDLVNYISSSYDIKKEVFITFEIENIYLTIQNAMPYGLVLNELITNTFKYAYKNNKNPILSIKILQPTVEKILLEIKDNGTGLKKDFIKISNETLGLKLINMIVKHQIQGNISYEYQNGAKFTIEGKIIN
jgi:two-component sensor histidine kinase